MNGWDSIDLTMLFSLIASIVAIIGFAVKSNKNNNNKILSMLEKQVDNLQQENKELRNKVDKLQNDLLEILKDKKNNV